MDPVFRSIASAKPFEVLFGHADYFEGDEAILFLKPDPSDELRTLHNRAVEDARSRGLMPRHHGDEWVPHCTCDYGVSKAQVSIGLSILNRVLPLPVRIVEIGYVEVTPHSVDQFAITTLGANQAAS
jgi:2'-5' RNA ligase